MKTIIPIPKQKILVLFFSPIILAAQIKMGERPLEIDSHAIFEIESSNKGVLISRMSSEERDNAFGKNTPNGLLIFNLTNNSFEYFDAKNVKWNLLQTQTPQLKIQENRLFLAEDNSVDLSPWMDNTDAQQLHLEGTILSLDNGGAVDLNSLFSDSEFQHLRLEGNSLILENGGSVDLSPLFSLDRDEQKLSLSNTLLSIERGGSVDLNPLLTPSPPQTIDHFKLVSNTLEISLSSDAEPPHKIALNSINSDTQQLSFSGTKLSLQNGGEVDLNPLLDNSDSQNISLSLTNSSSLKLEISNGNFITLTTSGNVSFSETGTNTVLLKMTQSPFTKEHHIISNKEHNWETDDFVFGSPHLDNDPASLSDNKRMFFDKSKAAFRAGIAQSNQWDDANRGTYSVAMGRNTIASGYHAVAMGLTTQSNAWYSTAMGQGTIAQSRSETVLGSYNTTYSPSGGTRDWDSSDRLFVIGNGTGSSSVSRTDALIVFKNGDALANGNWTGNGFNKLSDKRLKTKIKPLEIDHKKFMSLSPKQFEYKNIPSTIYYGFLAQNVEKIYPELVHEVPGSDSLKSIDYLGLIPILVEALKTQQHEINELKKQLNKR